MNNESLNTEEIVIVGSRYGDLADVVTPIFEKGEPIEEKDIKELLGGDEVYFSPKKTRFDKYSVAVYTESQRRLGYVWMYQSPALYRWLNDNRQVFVQGRITSLYTKTGLMIATMETPMQLKHEERKDFTIDEHWASTLPEVMTSITEQSLGLGIALLKNELTTARQWSNRLQMRIDNILCYLPSDLSAHSVRESMEIFQMMKQSDIKEVREQSELLLSAFVKRGSKNQMRWWVSAWLPGFFRDVAESNLIGLYKEANYTLERVEELLADAPHHLFYHFKNNMEDFANHLYYAALPQEVYNRLLTLLAVRDAMMKRESPVGCKTDDVGCKMDMQNKLRQIIEQLQKEGELKYLYDYTWLMEVMNQTDGLPHFDTPISFVKYMMELGYKNLPSKSTINKKQNVFTGDFPFWEFNDCDSTEANRRINLAKRFLSLFRKLSKNSI